MKKRIISILLCLTLLMSNSMLALAETAGDKNDTIDVYTSGTNPFYEGENETRIESRKLFTSGTGETTASAAEIFTTPEAAGTYLREQMTKRAATVTFMYHTPSNDINTLSDNIINEAFRHTGNPTEGDYLLFQFKNWGANFKGSNCNGIYELVVTYALTYYTTAQQEAAVNNSVEYVMDNLNLDAKNRYEKIKTIYDFVCRNVTYDYANLNNANHLIKYTAYGALINGTSVCQGYANLMYRLLLEAGIDARIISGTSSGEGHSWNIVKIGNVYYNLDATWDSASGRYTYFLKSNKDFPDHTRRDQFNTAAYNAAHPMSSTSYSGNGTETHTHTLKYVPGKAVTCSENGNIEYYTCTTCDKVFLDQYGNNATTLAATVIVAQGHMFVWITDREATETMTGLKHESCLWCGSNRNQNTVIEKLPHTHQLEKVEAIEPDCENNGWSEGEKCSICGIFTQSPEAIASLGHLYSEEWTIDKVASCSEEGSKSHHCTRNGCDARTDVTAVEKAPHLYMWVIDEEATEDYTGFKHEECISCGDTRNEGTVIDKLLHSHKMKKIGGKAATCQIPGNITYYTCTKCGKLYADSYGTIEITQEDTIIESAGHSYEWKVTKKATVSKDGSKYGTCVYCGDETGKKPIYKISSQTLSYSKVVYNGKVQQPELIIKDSKKHLLEEGIDYTVTKKTGSKTGRYRLSVKYKGEYSGSKTLYYTIVPKAPKSVKADLSTASSTGGYDDVKVTWDKSTGATGYLVYYKKATSSKWSSAGSTTKNYYTKKNLSDGISYDFKVVPYYKTSTSSTKYYDAGQYDTASVYTLKKMYKPQVERNYDDGVMIRWIGVYGETGYQISQSTSKKGTKIVKTPDDEEINVVTSAKKGTTYYYKIRPYKTVSGKKVYGPWSDVTTYKLKK